MHNLNEGVIAEQIAAIGTYLGFEIQRRKASKRKIAEVTGFSVNTINNIVAGKNATMHKVASIAWVLGMNFEQLVVGAAKHSPNFPQGLGISVDAGPVLNVEKVQEHMKTAGIPADQMSIVLGSNATTKKLIQEIP